MQEIAAASGEQSRGIEQVNHAVTEMDNVVQQVAASAEESASTSEEMSAQAAQVKTVVQELVVLVNGRSNGAVTGETSRLKIMDSAASPSAAQLPVKNKPVSKAPANIGRREIKPQQVLPLDDKEFEEF